VDVITGNAEPGDTPPPHRKARKGKGKRRIEPEQSPPREQAPARAPPSIYVQGCDGEVNWTRGLRHCTRESRAYESD